MAAFRFILNFRGMCTLVPRSDGRRAWILLQNVREFRRPGVEVEAHRALMKIDTENIRSRDGIPRNTSLVWPLGSSDVNIQPGGRPPATDSLIIAGFPPTGQPDLTDPTAVPANSFLWLAPLEAASRSAGNPPGGGHVLPELVIDDLSRDNASRLGARVHLRAGNLQTTQRASFSNKYIVWRFRPFKGCFFHKGHRQIVASQVTMSLDVVDDFVRMEVSNLIVPDKPYIDLYPNRGLVKVDII